MKFRKIILTLLIATSFFSVKGQIDQWTQLGMIKFPQNPSVQTTGMGRVSHLVFHPKDSNILFAVSASGGLWRSVNDGQTWKPLTDALPYTACASMCINHKNPATLFLGTGDANYYGGGMGVWKSTNDGRTWTQKNTGMGNVLVVQIAMHPTDTNILVATTNSGIFKTTDGGQNWVKKSTITDQYQDLVVKPGSKHGLYATSFKYFYHSKNFGETWTQTRISNTDTFSGLFIGASPADSNLVYCVGWRSSSWGNKTYFGGVYKSSDAGVNWKQQSANSPQILGYSGDGSTNDGQGSYNLTITVDPKDPATVYVGAINLWKSRDSAKTWKLTSHWGYGVHADKHHYIFSPHNPKKLYIAHDGALDRSLDTGKTWKTISDGLTASEFYKLGQSSLNREKALGGLQDNGLNYYKDGVFYTIRGGDYGGEFLFDYLDSNTQYFQGGGNRYNLNTFGSQNIKGIDNSWYELHRKDTNIMYMGYNHLYRTNDLRGALNWVKISDSLLHFGTATTTALAHNKVNSNILYWAKNNGVMYRVDRVNSANPTFVLLSKPAGNVQQIITHAKDSNVVYMTIGGKIYKSSNRGSTWYEFTRNLPGNYIVSFQTDDRVNDSSIYLATAFGVYYKNRTLSSWVSVSKNLPAIARITDMEIYNDGTPKGCIRVSTYGRGIWQTALYQNQTKKPVADFNISATSVKCPRNFILNDLSGGGKYNRAWNIIPYTGYKYINGTDSFSRQPEILITSAGKYVVTLTVSNTYGSSTLTKIIETSAVSANACSVNTNTFGNYNIGIYRFEMAGIDNSSTNSLYTNPNLEDFTCNKVAYVKTGVTYTVAITNGTLNNETGSIFIDYNNDGDFLDANELAGTIASGKGRRTTTVKILVSAPVLNTFIRMRVVSDFSTINGACGPLSYGQAEDYSLYIDNKRPLISWVMPKPKVYGGFKATLKLSEYCSSFDTSLIKFTNAKVTAMTKRSPIWYEFDLSPMKPGKIYARISANAFSDEVGNFNLELKDSTLFELGLNSFTFPGYSKRDSISHNDSGGFVVSYVYYNTKKDSLVPAFNVTDSAKVFVATQLQTSGVSRNNFTNPVLYLVKNHDQTFVKKYWVTVVTLPDTICELLTFSFKNPNVNGVFNRTSTGGSVKLTVPYGTSLSPRLAYYTISANASVKADNIPETSGVTTHNFGTPVLYKVTAMDTNYFKEYVVTVDIAKNTACDLLTWEIVTPSVKGTVVNKDTNGGFVNATVVYGTNKTNLKAIFTLSDNAILKITGVNQTSALDIQNYNDTVIAEVISEDGLHKKIYKIAIKTAPNDACEMFTFGFSSPPAVGTFTRDTTGGIIKIGVPENTNLTNLIAAFSLSDSAKAFVSSVEQLSGITANDFSSPKTYTVVSQSGLKNKKYQVEVSKILGLYNPNLDLFTMYPNPANNKINLSLPMVGKSFLVTIRDNVGREVFRGENCLEINISDFTPGCYEVVVKTKLAIQSKKLIKL